MGLGTQELVIILLILLLLVGGRKLPDLARSVGTSITEFRRSSKEALEDEGDEPDGATHRDAGSTRSDDEPRDRRDERDTRS